MPCIGVKMQSFSTDFEHLNWFKIVILVEFSLSFKNIILYDNGRVLIEADSEKEAKALYSKYIGN